MAPFNKKRENERFRLAPPSVSEKSLVTPLQVTGTMKARYLKGIMGVSPTDQEEEQHPSHRRTRSVESTAARTVEVPVQIVETDPSQSPPPALDIEDESTRGQLKDEDDFDCNTPNRSLRRRSSARFFFYALLLVFLEIGTAVVLKRFGIHIELNESIQSILPHFEHQFGRFNESIQSVLPHFDYQFGLFNESIPLTYLTQEKKRPGYQLHKEGATAHHPVVIIHGFVTSGLEVWAGKECARQHFRQRFWAAMYGARSMLTGLDCWREHMKLDPLTGKDPQGIRLRAAGGFEAIDYFMANYWVFGKMIENLADLGYSPPEMAVETYDWRLGFAALEERDGYLTRLRHRIEAIHHTTGKKVVLTSHSMGGLLVHYFFAWVTTETKQGGGGGGKKWVDEHIHAFINVAGSHLGVPKAASALLSGEMSDTVILNPIANMVEHFFGRKLRRELWTTWGSVWMMLPKGGDAIWGTGVDMCRNQSSTDPNTTDVFCPKEGLSPILAVSDVHNRTVQCVVEGDSSRGNMSAMVQDFVSQQTHTAKKTIDFLKAFGGGYGKNLSNANDYSYQDTAKPSPQSWHDPTRTPLPYAPNLKIYCLYGVGLETERAYYYRRNVVKSADGNSSRLDTPALVMDITVHNPEADVEHGIRYADGDGSVPLVSLGYICADAWQRKSSGLNPSGAKVYTREYKHRSEFLVDDPMRSGTHSGDHVDILGNVDMLSDLMRIVSDFEIDKVNENHIVSEIAEIAKQINSKGGIFEKKWYSR
jgi:phospholipid:diacylglycerol acyltransferase